MTGLLFFLVWTVPAALLMGFARLLGVKKWLWLVLTAMIGGVLPGMFAARVIAALVVFVDPQENLISGVLAGAAAGLMVGLSIWLVGTAVSRARKEH